MFSALCLLASGPVLSLSLPGQTESLPQTAAASSEPYGLPLSGLRVVVFDENRSAVTGARVDATRTGERFSCDTDFAGRCDLPKLRPGKYFISVQEAGFYVSSVDGVDFAATPVLEILLAHQQEFKETITVVASQPVIDPAQTASTETLDSKAIINIPYPTNRDIRAVLPFVPGVVADAKGQVHVAGSEAYETYIVLDGFDVTDPVSGLLNLRVSADAVRRIDVESSRYSVQYGKGSGGVIRFQTGMGEDQFRFSATNLLPSIEFKNGLNFDKWVPRASFSGPLWRGKAWFFDAPDAEIDSNIIKELPAGGNRQPLFRTSNLFKTQVNVSSSDILTGSFLDNWLHQDHVGLSILNPISTTTSVDQAAYFLSLKEQHTFSRGTLVEFGVGSLHVTGSESPLGSQPFFFRPGGNGGNAFQTLNTGVRRLQGLSNLYLTPRHALGRHDVQMGIEFDAINYEQKIRRTPIRVLLTDGTLSDVITFPGAGNITRSNGEGSAYLQDRWSLNDRLLIEAGGRIDRDEIVERLFFSPRIASTYSLTANTKFSIGAGVYYDATNLELISRPQQGPRVDTHYPGDPTAVQSSDVVSFVVNRSTLQVPRVLNLSLAVEHKFPDKIYLRSEYMRKRGKHEFVYSNETPAPLQIQSRSAIFVLTNSKQDHYDSLQTTVLRSFKNEHYVQASYTRSFARSNAVLDFAPDQLFNPLSAQQLSGPLSWDVPNRFLSYGWLPLIREFEFSYTLEWRTGLPFSAANQQQSIVGAPNSHRFPDYFDLATYVERRFRLIKLNWAVRGGFDNVTNRPNPSVVDSTADAPFFRLRQFSRRSFVVRMRFLGKK